MTNQRLAERRDVAVPRGLGALTQVYAARAEGAEIWDVEGKRYIDFAAGVAVVNTGHRHPKVVAAVAAQLELFTHTASQLLAYERYIALAERLNDIAPCGDVCKTMLATTGAEAVENAVKIARASTGRAAVVAFDGGFHGRTFLTMTMNGKVVPYKSGFGAGAGDVFHAPFPSRLHGISSDDSIAAIERLFRTSVEAERVAAIVFEPVQGEGGFYPAPLDFPKRLRALCDAYGILLIADEIQTGFARTGKLFACEHYEVEPDIITMAKGLGGGLPLAAITGRAEVMDAPSPGGLGGTYGGNPLAVAAAHAVLDVIANEGLCERAESLGARLRQRLESLREDIPAVAEVRGLGLMNAIEFMRADDRSPDADFVAEVRGVALRQGLILLPCGLYNNVLRFLPPITVSDAIFAEGLDILEDSLRTVARTVAGGRRQA